MHRLLLLLAAGLVVGACNPAAGPSGTAQEVQITATEFRFQSSLDTFKAGTPYRFVVKNAGSVAHEWAVTPRGAGGHSNMLVEVPEKDLGAGKTVTKDFTFPRAGQFEVACHLPGHYESGMVLAITVS